MAADRQEHGFEGYITGDVTYCVDPVSDAFFPVRVIKVGRKFVDVEWLNSDQAALVAPHFEADSLNRRFLRPRLPPRARFGGCDERPVNAGRVSGQELRLLPQHYGTLTGRKIKERHVADPILWPLPTGIVFERWFRATGK